MCSSFSATPIVKLLNSYKIAQPSCRTEFPSHIDMRTMPFHRLSKPLRKGLGTDEECVAVIDATRDKSPHHGLPGYSFLLLSRWMVSTLKQKSKRLLLLHFRKNPSSLRAEPLRFLFTYSLGLRWGIRKGFRQDGRWRGTADQTVAYGESKLSSGSITEAC